MFGFAANQTFTEIRVKTEFDCFNPLNSSVDLVFKFKLERPLFSKIKHLLVLTEREATEVLIKVGTQFSPKNNSLILKSLIDTEE